MKYAALLLLTLFFACAEDKSVKSESARPQEDGIESAPVDGIESPSVSVDTAMAMPTEEAPVLIDRSNTEVESYNRAPSVGSAPKSVPMPSAPQSKPRSMEQQPDMFLKTGRAGIPLSKYATAQSCVGKSKSSFTTTLQPKSAMDLVSFVVYATDCGGLNLTISGPDISETAQIVLTKGKNLIELEDYDIRLRAGTKYTMTGTGITGKGGCASTKPPMFEDVSKCNNVVSENHPSLTVDQKKMPCVFELRFLYQ